MCVERPSLGGDITRPGDTENVTSATTAVGLQITICPATVPIFIDVLSFLVEPCSFSESYCTSLFLFFS